MAAAVALLALAVVVLAVQLARSERELRSIARFLVDRDTLSNTRVTVSVHTRGFVRLGQAINRQIDRHQGERIAAEENKRDLRRGLTYLSHDIRTPLSERRATPSFWPTSRTRRSAPATSTWWNAGWTT